MAVIRVFTDDGQEVTSMRVDDKWSLNTVARNVCGHLHAVQGWLGRALEDARVIQAGGDPERPSEKAMRLTMEKRSGNDDPAA